MPGLQPPLKPQLDAARLRGRRSMPKPSYMFPRTDPLIDAAYKGTQCMAFDMLTGEKYTRYLKDFNCLRHRPYSFPKRLQENMLAARIRVPTPIQKRAMPAVARGIDVLATAPTGTGKTAAFLLPLIGALLRRHSREGLPRNKAYPAMVVLVPTHELVMQVHEECAALCRATHLRVVALHGGQPIVEEVMAMRKGYSGGGTDIVVATPGRLLDHVERRKTIRLERLAHIVVDEADKLLDLGFEPELRRLMSHLQMPPQDMRQMVLFCASLPQEVRELASKLLKPNYIHITAGLESGVAFLVSQHIIPVETQHTQWSQQQEQLPSQGPQIVTEGGGQPGPLPATTSTSSTLVGTSTSTPSSAGSSTEESQPSIARATSASGAAQEGDAVFATKLRHLAHHVSSNSSSGGLTLVFANTIPQAVKVYSSLAELGHSVSLLHSGLSQASRDETIQCFRYGVTPIMVATGVAARGLDVPDITHVINFDTPRDIHEYVYRIGRTGRAGRHGTSTTYLAVPQDRAVAHDLVAVMQGVGQAPPPWLATLAQKQGAGRARRSGVHVSGWQPEAEGGSEREQDQEQERGQDSKLGTLQEQQPPQCLAALAGEGQQGGLLSHQAQEDASGQPRLPGQGSLPSQQVQGDAGGQSKLSAQGSLPSQQVQGDAGVRQRLPGQSALVMESGDWSDAAIDVGSLLQGSAPTASPSSSSSSGPFDTASSTASNGNDISTEGRVSAKKIATTLEASKLKKQRGVFNRYVATWWGAGPALAPMLNPRQQHMLQRQLQWRQQHSQQVWQQQQQQQQHELGERGASSSAAMGAGGGASKLGGGGGGGGELSDQQLLRQWSEVITKGMARLPSAKMRKRLIKRGALQANKARLEKEELKSMAGNLRGTSQKDKVKGEDVRGSSRQGSATAELAKSGRLEVKDRAESRAQQQYNQQSSGDQLGPQAASVPGSAAALPRSANLPKGRAKPTAKSARAQQPPTRSRHLYDLF